MNLEINENRYINLSPRSVKEKSREGFRHFLSFHSKLFIFIYNIYSCLYIQKLQPTRSMSL